MEKTAKFMLSGLGKSTLRGIKRCPKCLTSNGTRSFSCKNKNCDVVFKEVGEKKKDSIDVCRLDTGTSTRVYSVKVKDKGPVCRGFVLLPIIDDSLNQVSALCFIDSCQRLFDNDLLKCHEPQTLPSPNIVLCSHILSATKCNTESQALKIEHQALQSLRIPDTIREEIWRRVNESSGPLVQRVSKSVMAVRCEVTTLDPLGFLHVTFVASSRSKDVNCHCTCSSSEVQSSPKSSNCIHYYACLAAFASDQKLAEEFEKLVENESYRSEELDVSEPGIAYDVKVPMAAVSDKDSDDCEADMKQAITTISDIDQDFDELSQMDSQESTSDSVGDRPVASLTLKPMPTKDLPGPKIPLKRLRSPGKDTDIKEPTKQAKIKPKAALDEFGVDFSFLEWLGSATERINQSIHYERNGKPDSLVFHIPHRFFECLRARIVGFPEKKALSAIKGQRGRSDRCYTWFITNVLHAKAVFDTPKISLSLSKTFAKNSDGSFTEIESQSLPQEATVLKQKGMPTLRPLEYKAFLNIGITSPDQSGPYALGVFWKPNFLPISKIEENRKRLELTILEITEKPKHY
ncbi:Chromosome 2 open reading frame 42 [Nesidiocoris tenuis]|uniref:Chromosome 2 open reading frame 42 n=1 Tax=Nesidiocoris tenuis TaxID=355587 RepID=A0ABN7AW10_9HEMI|nr:Chromosome 2 open reading frame 42 [Nesidiocoris tenuis]